MDKRIDPLVKATVFFMLDVRRRYWQVEIDKRDQEKQLSRHIIDFTDVFVYHLDYEAHLDPFNKQ